MSNDQKSIAHRFDMNQYGIASYPDRLVPWEPEAPPLMSDMRMSVIGRLRSCAYCGSMHPADLAAAIRSGAKASWADRKYGWPHKAYADGIPNPHAGMLEVRSSSSSPSEHYSREVREPRYDERTGDRIADYVRYTEQPRPAAATTYGKFYSVHLQDATPEDRELIERHLGIAFDFDDKGGVRWQSAQAKYGSQQAGEAA